MAKVTREHGALVMHYLPTEIDVRLMEDDGFRRTQLAKDARQCASRSDEWKRKLIEEAGRMVQRMKPLFFYIDEGRFT